MKKPLKSQKFRDLYKNLIFIRDMRTVSIIKNGYGIDVGDDEGILAYGYINELGELAFSIMTTVKFVDGAAVFNDEVTKRKLKHKIKIGDVENLESEILEIDPDYLQRFLPHAMEINKQYITSSELETVRANEQLDNFRHFDNPDDLEAFVYHSDTNRLEGLWVRSKSMTKSGINAVVLTPVSSIFGIELGDEIEFQLYEINAGIRLMKIVR